MLIEGQAARVARSRGYDEHWHSNSGIDQHLFPIYEMSTFQDMMNTGKPLIVGDVPNYPGWTDFDRTNWMQSMLGAPIQLEGSTIGFLNLASDRKHTASPRNTPRYCRLLPIRSPSRCAMRACIGKWQTMPTTCKHRSSSAPGTGA